MSINIFNLFQRPYTIVPQCVNCGSWMTGRYLNKKAPKKSREHIIIDALKNGEIYSEKHTKNDKNCFCVACGFSWKERLPISFLTKAEIEEQKKLRKTDELLEAVLEQHDTKKRNCILGFLGDII